MRLSGLFTLTDVDSLFFAGEASFIAQDLFTQCRFRHSVDMPYHPIPLPFTQSCLMMTHHITVQNKESLYELFKGLIFD